MKKTNIFLLIAICIFLQSCNTISQGFKSPKQNKSDEFLVEKKSPLKLPPNYNELPTPVEKIKKDTVEEQSIKDLISENKDNSTKSDNKSTLESLVLEKVKGN
tara:strand:+ start:575 stop:883 length:309 start_codon:yes stop_codon:yes gene_type:complete